MSKKKNNKNSKTPFNAILGNIFIWIVIVIVALTIANSFSPFEESKEISYTEYQNYLEKK